MNLRSDSFIKRHTRLFRYVPFFLWIGLIFYNSTSMAAMSETSRFVRPLLEFFFPSASDETLAFYHSYIRKSAHLFEYGILAFFAARLFWSSSREYLAKKWVVVSLLAVIAIACADELNQGFNPTRTGSVYDVAIDTFGGVIMLSFLVVYKRFRNN